MNLSNGSIVIATNSGSHGTYTMSGGSLHAKRIIVNSNGEFDFNGGDLLPTILSLNGTGRATLSSGGDKVLRTTSLTIDVPGTSRLDVSDNNAIVDYTGASPLSTIKGYILSGYNGGWTGNGITSSSAASVAADAGNIHKTALGYGEASTLGLSSCRAAGRLDRSAGRLHAQRRCQSEQDCGHD
jgi:hypothetical protein